MEVAVPRRQLLSQGTFVGLLLNQFLHTLWVLMCGLIGRLSQSSG